jgi:hypothetical protein
MQGFLRDVAQSLVYVNPGRKADIGARLLLCGVMATSRHEQLEADGLTASIEHPNNGVYEVKIRD